MENEEERPTTRTSRSLVGVLALHGCLFDACAVALLQHRPFLAYPSSLASYYPSPPGGGPTSGLVLCSGVHSPCCNSCGRGARRVNAVVGGDGCARVAGLMRRWHLLDDDTLPFVAALSAHFPPDELFVLDIAYATFCVGPTSSQQPDLCGVCGDAMQARGQVRVARCTGAHRGAVASSGGCERPEQARSHLAPAF